MTDPQDDPRLRRIRLLLAQAEDPGCTPEEAEAFNAKAAELIARYGIDQALLASSDSSHDGVVNQVMILDDPYAKGKASLLVNVARPLRVQVIFNIGVSRQIKGFRVHVFGHQSDVKRVEILFHSLLVQASIGLTQEHPGGQRSPSQVAAFRRDWMAGFGNTVRERLQAAENRATRDAVHEGSPGVELVLFDRNKAVAQAVGEAYPELGKTHGRRVRNSDAWHAGAAAGSTADLGQARLNR